MRKNVVADNLNITGTLTASAATVASSTVITAANITAQSANLVTNETNNRVVTSLGAGAGLNGEANLTFDGSTLSVTGGVTVAAAGALTHTNYQLSGSKALTAGVATTFVSVAVPSNGLASGMIQYSIIADDDTDFQTQTGLLFFAAVNKAGTVTYKLRDNLIGADADSLGTGAGLTNAFTAAEDADNVLAIKATAASDLTENTLTIYYRALMTYPNVITAA